MNFPAPLIPATLIRRYKRFLADVRLENGQEITAHCANPGAMIGLAVPGSRIWLSPNQNPKAKLPYRWELEEVESSLVGINTTYPNRIVEEALAAGRIPELAGYRSLRREVAYGQNSRVDFLLEGPDLCFVEVKNVHLKRADRAEFPDSVTSRGAKHLAELSAQVAQGHRAVMLYLVQRQDCARFGLASDLDPVYAREFEKAYRQGVQVLAYACNLSQTGINLDCALPLDL